jgi:nitronate monooxygenase
MIFCSYPFVDSSDEPAPPMVGTTGEIEALSLWAGQSVGLARQTQPAAEIVAELISRL